MKISREELIEKARKYQQNYKGWSFLPNDIVNIMADFALSINLVTEVKSCHISECNGKCTVGVPCEKLCDECDFWK